MRVGESVHASSDRQARQQTQVTRARMQAGDKAIGAGAAGVAAAGPKFRRCPKNFFI